MSVILSFYIMPLDGDKDDLAHVDLVGYVEKIQVSKHSSGFLRNTKNILHGLGRYFLHKSKLNQIITLKEK